ncbi:unnamed protein product [Paramecium sonneborni]|uniref:Uncharacterized protein n=1 Tax=Paramecium sonneborni TaxID=65129 RepID=A0A8S1RQC3_9CILI|nr:unnamed protein product [Paramecium sonneborni]
MIAYLFVSLNSLRLKIRSADTEMAIIQMIQISAEQSSIYSLIEASAKELFPILTQIGFTIYLFDIQASQLFNSIIDFQKQIQSDQFLLIIINLHQLI